MNLVRAVLSFKLQLELYVARGGRAHEARGLLDDLAELHRAVTTHMPGRAS